VVHVCTPNHLHAPLVEQALAAGKHVVCEKPLAMTSVESGELLGLAEASGLVHCTNFNIRFYPMIQEARARVDIGELGEVWNVTAAICRTGCSSPPTGTGGSSPSAAARCAPSATLARTGSTSSSS